MTDERKQRPSASGMGRYKACLASFLLGAGQPDQETVYSEAGTRIHARIASKLETDNFAPAMEGNDAETESVNDLFRQVEEIEAREFPGVRPARIIEQRQWYEDDTTGPEFYSGQPDVVLLDSISRKAVVLDFKTGWKELDDSTVNLQLRALAILIDCNYEVDQILTGILRPNKKPDFALYTRPTLNQATRDLIALVEDITTNQHEPTAGPHCCYCPARGICPAAHETVMSIVNTKPQIATIETMDDDKLNQLLRAAAAAGPVIKSIQEEAKRRLHLGQGDGLDFTLKPGNKVSKVEDTMQAFTNLSSELTAVEFLGATDVSVTKLREVIRHKKGLTIAQAKDTTDALLGEALTFSQNAPSLTIKPTAPPLLK